MASSSETSEVCSPAGSILITRTPEDLVPFRFFTGVSEVKTALGEALPHIGPDDSKPPNVVRSQEQDSGDWIHWDTLDPAVLRLTSDESESLEFYTPKTSPQCPPSVNQNDSIHKEAAVEPQPTYKPFHKWMRTLRRRAGRRQHGNTIDEILFQSTSVDAPRPKAPNTSHRRDSSSGSSFGFVEAVKTASASLASGSVFARSRRNSMRSSQTHTHTDRSSRASISSKRYSEDSGGLDRPQILDKDAVERSLQRRRILEELISTEEGYIGDVRFLMNVYVTILVSLPTMPLGLRSSINRNLADVVDLHEELLGELHRAVPHSEHTQLDTHPASSQHGQGHRRIRSLNVVPEDDGSMTWLETVPGMVAEPNVAADVAKIFTNKMNRFFVYEEYGAKYEMMIKDIALAHRTMPQWDTYQKGLETLASSVGSSSNHADKLKKSLTIGDLLVKPIQRVCKYPLLFAELLKYTPVADSPYAHMEVENALVRLREATSQINRATDDAWMKAALERTWLLQDRLAFPDSKLDAASKNRIRSFGHIQLCGVLHACWQSKDGIQGQYLVALLYKDWLCLASASKVDQIYTLQACVPLNEIKVEAVDNGRGLQCHTAPFSWKIVFECDYELYEMILTACTPREEDEWRSRLELVSVTTSQEHNTSKLYSLLFLNMKGLGTVFGKQGGIARKVSIHRAITVSPRSPLCNVIIRNTSVGKDALSSANASINRSQSLLATKGRVPMLAPSRGDRARLEALLSDVWTREILPFPGMTVRARNEHLIRTSAHSVMRKLSVTSFASTFTKRSASLVSINRGGSDGGSGGEGGSARMVEPGTKSEIALPAEDMRLDCGDVNKSHLEVVDSDSDCATPPTIRAHAIINPISKRAGMQESCSPRRRICMIKNSSTRQLGELTAGLNPRSVSPSPSAPTVGSALRARSANGPQVKRQASLLSRKSIRSACSAVNGSGRGVRKRRTGNQQELGDTEPQEGPCRSSSRLSTRPLSISPNKSGVNRWSRVDTLRRRAVARGIQGFFR